MEIELRLVSLQHKRRTQKTELGSHPLKSPNVYIEVDLRRHEVPPVTEVQKEALTNRAARAVVGTRSQYPDMRARPPLNQAQDSSEEVTALKPRNPLHSKDKRNTTETSLPTVIYHRPT
ncbi:hypothetical protein NDU88_001264 [Pleurodeles waltl]|uniref:Uncharacterized protein n=1 Tax=Pleurodeles waltl TaxID=8319 RepID=A0AAV7RCB3_PLEWA|nr:hypothetical protein NDU88_001264 [Pleurodeles waltl]